MHGSEQFPRDCPGSHSIHAEINDFCPERRENYWKCHEVNTLLFSRSYQPIGDDSHIPECSRPNHIKTVYVGTFNAGIATSLTRTESGEESVYGNGKGIIAIGSEEAASA